MSGTKGNGATHRSAMLRKETDDLVIATLEKFGALARYEIGKKAKLSDSTVHLSIDRLRREGSVRMIRDKRRAGPRGILSFIYEIGMDEEMPLKNKPEKIMVRRHEQDIALFGEYRGK